MANVKVGIALGGGAARGWAHIGVLQALREAGIEPAVVAGTSMGAVIGGCYVADRLEHLTDFARALTRRRVFGYLDFNFAGTGLISGQRLCSILTQHLGDYRIEELDRPFTAVATEIATGHEIWLSRGRLVDAMCASYALPGVFRPVNVEGRWLFDGALVNPIPVSVCRAMGARYVIAVNLNTDLCGRGTVVPHLTAQEMSEPEEPAKGGNGRAALALLRRQFFGRGENVPGLSTVMVEAFNIVQDRIARSRLAGDPPDAFVNPRLAGVGLFDFHRAQELIDRGYEAARRVVDDIVREVDTRARLEPAVKRLERQEWVEAGPGLPLPERA
jgi:NTE family protein